MRQNRQKATVCYRQQVWLLQYAVRSSYHVGLLPTAQLCRMIARSVLWHLYAPPSCLACTHSTVCPSQIPGASFIKHTFFFGASSSSSPSASSSASRFFFLSFFSFFCRWAAQYNSAHQHHSQSTRAACTHVPSHALSESPNQQPEVTTHHQCHFSSPHPSHCTPILWGPA